MIRSMTAFGGAETEWEGWILSAEIRSVNHRFLDIALRLPETLRALEPSVRRLIGEHAKRGRIECSLSLKSKEGCSTHLKINQPLIEALLDTSRTIENLAGIPLKPFSSLDLLGWPGVLHQTEIDRDELQHIAREVIHQALEKLVFEREREGLQLRQLIKNRCECIQIEASKARERLPIARESQRTKLLNRLSELASTPDTDRLEQELLYLAQKMDVAEELDRLELHIDEILKTLHQKEPAGRRLDFLVQELHREANTLGSKSADAETTRHSVEIKVLIEQIREQVQNLE